MKNITSTDILRACHNIEDMTLEGLDESATSEDFKKIMFKISSEMFKRNVISVKEVDSDVLGHDYREAKSCKYCGSSDLSIVYRLKTGKKTYRCENCGHE